MLRKFLLVAAALVVPALLPAQGVPNAHASDTAKSKVAAHQQNPQVPAQEASDVAKAKVAQHRATRARGKAEGLSHRPVTPAVPAMPGAKGAVGTAAVPASPASPSAAPSAPGARGQSGSRRP